MKTQNIALIIVLVLIASLLFNGKVSLGSNTDDRRLEVGAGNFQVYGGLY